MASSCQYGHCGRPARFEITLKIWALAMPPAKRNDSNCLRMMTGLGVCEECSRGVKAQNFLLPEGRARIAAGINRAGGALPDFDRAELDLVDLVDRPTDIEQMVADAKRAGGTVIES